MGLNSLSSSLPTGLSGETLPMKNSNTVEKTDLPTEIEETTDTSDDEELPIDRGWAWVVLAGSILQMFFVNGMLRCDGIVFVEIQKRFQSSASETSLIMSLSKGVNCVSALLLSTVGMKLLGCRVLVMTGGVVMCSAYMVTSQAEVFSLLFLSHGVMKGIGQALVIPPMMSMIAVYFHKRRGLANSLTASGASLGSMVMAPLVTELFGFYAFSGAFLVISGFVLQACVSGALYRPLDMDKIKDTRCKSKDNSTETNSKKVKVVKKSTPFRRGEAPSETCQVNDPQPYKHLILSTTSSYDQSLVKSHESHPFIPDHIHKEHVRRRNSSASIGSLVVSALSNSKSNMFPSIDSLGAVDGNVVRTVDNCKKKYQYPLKETDHNATYKESTCKLLKSILDVFDVSLFKNPVFVMVMLSQSLLATGLGVEHMYIAPHARDVGLTENQIGILLAVLYGVEVFGRPMLGIIADTNKIETAHIVALGITVIGVSAECITLYDSYGTLFVFCVIYGCCGGVHMALLTVLLAEYIGLEKIRSAIGFSAIFTGSSVAFGFYVVGLLRDSTNSYIVPYRVVGGLNFLAAVMLCSTAYIHRRRRRQLAQQSQNVNV